MDHTYIEGHNIPDRYLQGTLSPSERASFEEHFVDCATCLDRLELTEALRGGLRTIAAEDASRPRALARPGLREWLIGLTSGRQMALLAAAALVLVALPAALLLAEIGQWRRQVDQARLSAAEWQRKYEDSQQAASATEQALQARERELSKQRLEFEAERERGQQGGRELQGQQARLEPTAPIFDLNVVRSTGQAPTRLAIPTSARWVVLKLDIEPDPELLSYRATLLTSDQRIICRASDMIAVNEALAIGCDASLFRPGAYRLTLEGATRQGRQVPAGTYAFQVGPR